MGEQRSLEEDTTREADRHQRSEILICSSGGRRRVAPSGSTAVSEYHGRRRAGSTDRRGERQAGQSSRQGHARDGGSRRGSEVFRHCHARECREAQIERSIAGQRFLCGTYRDQFHIFAGIVIGTHSSGCAEGEEEDEREAIDCEEADEDNQGDADAADDQRERRMPGRLRDADNDRGCKSDECELARPSGYYLAPYCPSSSSGH